MNKFACILALLITTALWASVTIAYDGNAPAAVVLNKFPSLNADELKQIPFKASMSENTNPKSVQWELHNPFRNKTIAGLVIIITYKTPSADKPVSIELFVKTNCGPLQSDNSLVTCFDAEEVMKASPTITLKEVHYVSDDAEPTIPAMKP